MRMFPLLIFLCIQPALFSFSQGIHYICYRSDDARSPSISVRFSDDRAVSVTYAGRKEAIPLRFVKRSIVDGYATTEDEYVEIVKGRKTGTYRIIHAGIWDYVVYRRLKDGRQFRFTIDHEAALEDGEYRKTACF